MRVPANFDEDVRDPTTVHVQQLGLDWLATFPDTEVEDVSAAHLPWDARLQQEVRADVKADRWLDRTGNVVFEDRHVYADGRVKPGWGHDTHLHLLVIVATPSLYAVALDVPHFRTIVRERMQAGVPRGWLLRQAPNLGYVTHNICVPLAELRREGVVRRESDLAQMIDHRRERAEQGIVGPLTSRARASRP